MSLEQALADNTATMKQLIAVLSTVAEDSGSLAPNGDTTGTAEATTGKRTRRTKAQIEADAAAAGAAGATAQTVSVPTNQTGAPIFVIVDKHNTAAAIQPGEVIPSIEGMRQVSEAEYNAYKLQQAGAVTTATNTAVVNAGPVPTFQQITDRLMKIHGKGGNDGVLKVLSAFKAGNVPALAQADLAAVDKKVHEVEVELGLAQPAAGASNLFG